MLTNPTKKKIPQQRWYDQSIGKRKTQEVITPVSLLKQALELERYTSKLDVFRMDKEGLKDYILDLLSPSVVDLLKKFNELTITRQIINTIIKSANPRRNNRSSQLPNGFNSLLVMILSPMSRSIYLLTNIVTGKKGKNIIS